MSEISETTDRINRLLWIADLEMLAWEIERLAQSRDLRIETYLEVMKLTFGDLETVH